MTAINGVCEHSFYRVGDALADGFSQFAEVGAAIAVWIDGQPVVDLWAGHRDEAKSVPWDANTIVNCASTTKGMVGLCANMLVDRGLLDVDAPVAKYWPEFAQHGKESLPVRFLLDHRAGLPMIERPLPPEALLDWDLIVGELAGQAPMWEPGSTHGYHAVTYGFLVGEVIRRITGRTVGTFLREEVTDPLDAAFLIGTPECYDDDCASAIAGPLLAMLSGSMPADPIAYRRAEIPAGNGHGNARGLATIYGALACGGELNGVTLLSADTLAAATNYEITGPWFGRVDGGFAASRFCLGFVLNSATSYMGPESGAFGYSGFGGSIAFADPANRLSFAYTPNAQLTLAADKDSRSGRLVDAVYASLND